MMVPSRKKMYVAILVMLKLVYIQHTVADDGQFSGGSMSCSMEQRPDGTYMVSVEQISGWVLGMGPCGQGCSKSDIGRSTRSTRTLKMASDPYHFGNFTSEYLDRSTRNYIRNDLNADVDSTYNESVLAVSEGGGWEQDLMRFSFIISNKTSDYNVKYEGRSWRQLTLQAFPSTEHLQWYMECRLSSKKRNDTGKPNRSPQSFFKPFYRVKLDETTGIHIPAIDADGDLLRCELAKFVEGGGITLHPPPNVKVLENCTVYINASMSNNYTDYTWIAVAVTVRDYPRATIIYGDEVFPPVTYSLSGIPVQFVVKVIANLVVPEFVEPTIEGGHTFILYGDTTWRARIYAEAAENTTLDSLTAIGLHGESFLLSALQEDPLRPQVKYATVSWKPSDSDIGNHIACINAEDNTGVDSTEQRCFILDVRGEGFNYTTNYTTKELMGKPYFVDIPAPDIFVKCKVHVTCVVALFVKSLVQVTSIWVTESYVDDVELSPIQLVTHKSKQMYQADLSFEHHLHGKGRICFMASDKNGGRSDEVCIQVQIEPKDPCLSAPCKNGGQCVSDMDTGAFKCLCFPRYSGKTCSIKEDRCKQKNPCVLKNTIGCYDVRKLLYCYCKPGFGGTTCTENIDDCVSSDCGGHGICKDLVNNFVCECFDRYNGTNCAKDACPSESAGVTTCPAAGCHLNSCNGNGVCSNGGICSCPYGLSGQTCETRRCNISADDEVEIISPSIKDGSMVVCYMGGDKISPCTVRIYLALHSGLAPTVEINSTKELRSAISVGNVTKSSVIPGVSSIYTTDIYISGRMNDSKVNYLCVKASTRNSRTSVCYELTFAPNPENNTRTLAYLQRNATVKFVLPTLKDHSRLVCNTGEKCRILMYTSFSSRRHVCRGNTSTIAAAAHGLRGCDLDDKDNDEDDPDTATKSEDPCCKNVISSTAGVQVFKPHPRGPSCVTEATFRFTSPGEKQICFLSAETDSQQLCYAVWIYDRFTDPCSKSPCLNNGRCFNTGQNSSNCICPDKYIGAKCQRGPCQHMDNNCQNGAYCQTNDGVATCICRAGFSGPRCNIGPSFGFNHTYAEFTDAAKPVSLPCVIHQPCSMALILTSQSSHIPKVSAGYIDPSLSLESLHTVNRLPIKNSYQANILVKAFELGVKDICVQTKDTNGLNKDEICVKVKVVSDVISIYGFKDRPHFVDPSLPTDAVVECIAGRPCHIIYRATAGEGHEQECLTFQLHPPDGFVNYHLFSSCDVCTSGDPGNGNCTLDISLVTGMAEVATNKLFCVSASLEGSTVEGERRCFNLMVTDPASVKKKGCQTMECRNGGFCDGHIPTKTLCFCTSGFSGSKCDKDVANMALSGSQTQSFIGDFAIPSQTECSVMQDCPIPLRIITKANSKPSVSLGFVDTGILVSKPLIQSSGVTDTIFEGYAVSHTNRSGTYRVCFQLNQNSKTEDELCVKVHTSTVFGKTETTRPYFIPPSIPSETTVLCEINKACHFNMHFTKGDLFGSPGKCPSVKQAGFGVLPEVHIFESVLSSTDCIVDVSYIPTLSQENHKLCLQVALPGKKGETRCFSVRTVLNISQEVLSPCRGVTCSNGGQCNANLSFSPYKTECVCLYGYSGTMCNTVKLTLNGPDNTYLKVPVGSELTMNCSVSGLHPPTFYWSKLNACDTKYQSGKASTYHQSHASLTDAGTYVCTASDGHGPNVASYFHVDIISDQNTEVCDFDDGTLCDWTQQQNDNFDWTFQNGPTQSDGTGPDVDHTLGTLQGKYVYIESSSPRAFGEQASLLSHVLPANRTVCFEFWYYMFGDGIGGLFVLIQDTCLKTETQLLKETGDHGAQWNKGSVTINKHSVPNDYRIVINADVGPTYHGDTAVDDLAIHDGPCRDSNGAPIVG